MILRSLLRLVLLAGPLLVMPAGASAFSVLVHQAVVDRSWDRTVVPALLRRYPDTDPDALERARGFAHGGSHIADIGYFPFGNRVFTDLVHYVRSGDFIVALLDGAETVDEYAFALGAASHHVADAIGHPDATNPTVAELYPRLRRKYGPEVTYADDPSAHIETEFRFDVRQVGRDPSQLDLVRHAVAFEVAEPVLERAFQRTYGLRLEDVLHHPDVAIRTYRWAFRGLIQEATGIAWELYRADIRAADPTMTPAGFVWELSRGDFERQFGDAYRRAGYFARFVAFVTKLVPDVGPFRNLAYEPLPPDAQARFDAALARIVAEYQLFLGGEPGRERVADVNLDTGRPVRHGDYALADHAYAALLDELDHRKFADVSRALRADILRFYRTGPAEAAEADESDLRRELDRLAAAP